MMAVRSLPSRKRNISIWLLYIVGFMPALWNFYLGATGQIPGNSVKVFEHLLGIWALRYLLVTLSITPLRDLAGWNLIRYRRAFGLLSFWYVIMHFLTYLVLDQNLNIAAIIADIARRPFITIGMACLLLLLPLAVTSNNFSIRKLGSNWNRLHKLGYLIVIGGAAHYAMSVKVVTAEPFLYLVLAIILVAYRFFRQPIMKWRRKQKSKPELL